MIVYNIIERCFDWTTNVWTYPSQELAKAKFNYIIDEYIQWCNIKDDDEDLERDDNYFSYYERHSWYCEILIKPTLLDL